MPGNRDPKERTRIVEESSDRIFAARPKVYIRRDDGIFEALEKAQNEMGYSSLSKFILLLVKYALATLGYLDDEPKEILKLPEK